MCHVLAMVATFLVSFGVHAEIVIVAGRVVGVSDGDTITVLDRSNVQHKVRLAGIDAPEQGQAFGDRSKESLSSLAFNRTVEARCGKRDRYGREICKVLRDSLDVNLEQVRLGFAWWYREYANEQTPEDRAAYSNAERDARAYRLGLWKDAASMPPWEWRRNNKRSRAEQLAINPRAPALQRLTRKRVWGGRESNPHGV